MQGNYPTTERILEAIETGLTQGSSSGYDAEARALGELAMTSQPQVPRHISFANADVKKDSGDDMKSGPLNSVGILRGSLMGGGITYVTACKSGLPVRVKDINTKGINHVLGHNWDQLGMKVCRHHIKASGHDKQLALTPGSVGYRDFARCDLIIGAVFGGLSPEQWMIAEVERDYAPHIIFASSTSSLPIGDTTANATRPEQVTGLRFFSSVGEMPLIEMIPHTATSEQTIATTIKLTKKQGKTPIVVRGKAGFYVSHTLMPCINEAIRILTEGEWVETVDAALIKFGFPVGPIQPLGEVETDAGTKIIPVPGAAYGECFSASANVVTSVLNDNHRGGKSDRGFYLYDTKGCRSRKQVDPAIYTLIDAQGQSRLIATQIAERCVILVLNEIVRCFDGRIVHSAHGGDVGVIFGIGFPSSLDGPFRYMDSLGASEVVAALQRLTT